MVDFVEEERLEGLVKERPLWEAIQQGPLGLLDVGVIPVGRHPAKDDGRLALEEMQLEDLARSY